MKSYMRHLGGIPERLACAQAPATEAELALSSHLRSKYFLPGWPVPYLDNVVRALRLVDGCDSYMEVSSRDKGFLADAAGRLAPDAVVVDVDLLRYPDNEQILREGLAPDRKLIRVCVDPAEEDSPAAVLEAVGETRFDVVFVNFGARMNEALSAFSGYFDFVKPGGIMLMNDVCWEGDDGRRGIYHALSLVNAHLPVYCIHTDEPVHRLAPREVVGGEWGTLGVILKP